MDTYSISSRKGINGMFYMGQTRSTRYTLILTSYFVFCAMVQMHIMQMERELEAVRGDRDRQALFLTRILREVDHKVRCSGMSKEGHRVVVSFVLCGLLIRVELDFNFYIDFRV